MHAELGNNLAINGHTWPLDANTSINATFSKSKIGLKIENKFFSRNRLRHEVPTTYTNLYANFGINQLINLTHIRFRCIHTYLLTTFPKSKTWLKIEKKKSKNNDWGNKFLLPEQTCMQNLASIDQQNNSNKHLGANTLINSTFSNSIIGLVIKKNLKTYCGMMYLAPKHACMQNLVSIGP